MKKVVFLLLLTIVTFTLAANGKTDEGSVSSEGGQIQGDLDVYAFVGPIKMPYWDAVVEEFNSRYPDVNVNMVGNAKIHDQIRPMIVAGDPPDVYFNAGAGRITIEQMYTEDLALQLDSLLDEQNWEGTETLRDSILPYRMDVVEGHAYGIQLPFHLVGFFYHEPTFEKNGWTVPTNFDEFMAVSKKMVQDGVAPMTTTGVYPYYFEHFVIRAAVASAGGEQALLDWKELKPGFFTSDIFKNVIRKYEEVIDAGYLLKDSEALNHIESELEWINGNSAFVTSGTWIESEMSKDFPEGYREGIRFIPSFFIDSDQEMTVVPYGNASTAIFKDGGNVSAAKEFVKAMYSIAMSKKMTETTNILSNVPEANAEAHKSPAIQSALAWMDTQKQIAWPEGGYITKDVTKEIQSQLQALMVGGVTADEMCLAIEAKAEAVRNDPAVVFIEAFIPR